MRMSSSAFYLLTVSMTGLSRGSKRGGEARNSHSSPPAWWPWGAGSGAPVLGSSTRIDVPSLGEEAFNHGVQSRWCPREHANFLQNRLAPGTFLGRNWQRNTHQRERLVRFCFKDRISRLDGWESMSCFSKCGLSTSRCQGRWWDGVGLDRNAKFQASPRE